jgi:hypothetical protein
MLAQRTASHMLLYHVITQLLQNLSSMWTPEIASLTFRQKVRHNYPVEWAQIRDKFPT